MIEIRRVGAERRHPLVATLAGAFADDPFIGWVLSESPFEPGEAQLRWWNGALAAMEGVAVLHANQDSSAVAVWVPPHDPTGAPLEQNQDHDGDAVPSEGDDGRDFVDLVNGVCGAGAGERLSFFADLYSSGPDEPHWHLTAVAVAPAAQNQGLGRKVMKPLLDQCDRQGVPAYLEATTRRSRTLYERLGFEVTSTLGPVGGPKLALMWREPHN